MNEILGSLSNIAMVCFPDMRFYLDLRIDYVQVGCSRILVCSLYVRVLSLRHSTPILPQRYLDSLLHTLRSSNGEL